jgi:hypothetical protein
MLTLTAVYFKFELRDMPTTGKEHIVQLERRCKEGMTNNRNITMLSHFFFFLLLAVRSFLPVCVCNMKLKIELQEH